MQFRDKKKLSPRKHVLKRSSFSLRSSNSKKTTKVVSVTLFSFERGHLVEAGGSSWGYSGGWRQKFPVDHYLAHEGACLLQNISPDILKIILQAGSGAFSYRKRVFKVQVLRTSPQPPYNCNRQKCQSHWKLKYNANYTAHKLFHSYLLTHLGKCLYYIEKYDEAHR